MSAPYPPPVRQVAVIGAGLVGGSIARGCRERGLARVVLTDRDPDVRRRAAELGLADEVAADLAGAVAGADLVIAAVPSPVVPEVLTAAAPLAGPAAVLTDAASLKRTLTLELESRLRAGGLGPERFVGGHPMAGTEHSGPEAADAQLFQGATWVLTPTAVTDDAALQRLAGFLRGLGARVLVLPPDQHDRLVAVTSHLPQVVASVLADVAADAVAASGEAVLAVAGGGFRDTTRIAASDPELWLPILGGNRPAVLDALTRYRARLAELHTALETDDAERLRAILARASAARRELVPKERVVELADLVVPLPDEPGALAAVTTALGTAGVNVEDVAMRHEESGVRGVLLVRIAVAAVPRAVQALHRAGFPAHLDAGPATPDRG